MSLEFPQTGTHFLLRIITDGAGIEQNDIGIFPMLRQFRIGGFHYSCNDFAIRDVHLAAIGLNIEFFRHYF